MFLISNLFHKDTPEFQTAHNMSELGQVNDFATQSLPHVDTYQSSANSSSPCVLLLFCS